MRLFRVWNSHLGQPEVTGTWTVLETVLSVAGFVVPAVLSPFVQASRVGVS